MENEFIKEINIKDRTEEEKNQEILRDIIKTKKRLQQAHENFEFAQNDLVDYYSYNIKANQAKLDYLIKLAKKKGLMMNNEMKWKLDLYREVG